MKTASTAEVWVKMVANYGAQFVPDVNPNGLWIRIPAAKMKSVKVGHERETLEMLFAHALYNIWKFFK